jgi:hypothetical protein
MRGLGLGLYVEHVRYVFCRFQITSTWAKRSLISSKEKEATANLLRECEYEVIEQDTQARKEKILRRNKLICVNVTEE